jgi:hypothetical protein
MTGVSLTTEIVWGMEDERAWGFRTLLEETPVMNIFINGYVMNTMLKISC